MASLAALILFWRIVARWQSGFAGVTSLALFATAAPFTLFASQVKQYSFDVAVAVALLWLALDIRECKPSRAKALWLGVAGAVLVWFSQPSIFIVCAFAASQVLFARSDKRPDPGRVWPERLQPLGITSGLWLVSALLSALVGLAGVTSSTQEYLHRFWILGFPPVPISNITKSLWPVDPMEQLLGSGGLASLGYPLPTIYLALIGVGFVVLWRRDRMFATLLFGPVALTIAFAIAREYPFSDRAILFLFPSFFFAIGTATERIRQWLSRWSHPFAALVAVLITASAVYPMVRKSPVYRLEDIKPVLTHLREKKLPGDSVYVYYGAAPQVDFYASEYGLRQVDYAVGGCHRGDRKRYFEELDTFRGRPRVWILITHSNGEGEDILRYLDTIGLRRDRFTVKPRLMGPIGSDAEVYLYDLSDPARLSRATSLSSPIGGPSWVDTIAGCAEGPQSMTQSRGLTIPSGPH